jgi:hypothetical protein
MGRLVLFAISVLRFDKYAPPDVSRTILRTRYCCVKSTSNVPVETVYENDVAVIAVITGTVAPLAVFFGISVTAYVLEASNGTGKVNVPLHVSA